MLSMNGLHRCLLDDMKNRFDLHRSYKPHPINHVYHLVTFFFPTICCYLRDVFFGRGEDKQDHVARKQVQ